MKKNKNLFADDVVDQKTTAKTLRTSSKLSTPSPSLKENGTKNFSQTTRSVSYSTLNPSSNASSTSRPLKKDDNTETKKKKPRRTPFQRPFWMNLSRRPFRNSALRKPKSDMVVFPEDSLLIKGMRKPYVYIFPDFQLNDSGPNKGVYWKQFYNPSE